MPEKKENRGGKRENAGRKKSGKCRYSVWSFPENKEAVREFAKKLDNE